MKQQARPIIVAVIVAAVVSACGIWQDVSEADDCGLKPVGEEAAGLRIGPQQVAALCASMVEVDGRTYTVGVGRWLDEDALVLEEYAPITRSNDRVAEPVAYSLDGIDPLQFLVMKATDQQRDDNGPMSRYLALWGQVDGQPDGICPYADPMDPQYPGDECPLKQGRTYGAEMIVACGLDVPVGPYGGDYWRVVDPPTVPPAGSPYPGMTLDLDYGTIELLDDGALEYRSESGAILILERVEDPEAAGQACPRPEGY